MLLRATLAGPSRLPIISISRSRGLHAAPPCYAAQPRRPIRPAAQAQPSTQTQTQAQAQTKQSPPPLSGSVTARSTPASPTRHTGAGASPNVASLQGRLPSRPQKIDVPPLTAPWPYRRVTPVSASNPSSTSTSTSTSSAGSSAAEEGIPGAPTIPVQIDTSSRAGARKEPESEPEWIEEERTVFARPFEQGRPRMYWMAALVSGLFFTAWVVLPPRVGNLPVKEGEEKPRQTPTDVLYAYASSASVGFPAIIALTFLFLPSRYITRLSQVRIRPASPSSTTTPTASARERVFFRIKHAGHEMWSPESKRARPREVEMKDVRVRMLAGGRVRSPYLSLEILPPKPRSPPFSYFSFDAFPYRLDFRDSPLVETTEEEVVLSLNRVEHIFGRLDPGGMAKGPVGLGEGSEAGGK